MERIFDSDEKGTEKILEGKLISSVACLSKHISTFKIGFFE